jgi:hypothetical protein
MRAVAISLKLAPDSTRNCAYIVDIKNTRKVSGAVDQVDGGIMLVASHSVGDDA